MNQKKRFKFTDLLIGLIFTLLFISIGVVITINFRPLYYMDVNLLNIEADSGYSKADILNNYNTLIDYSSPFFKGDLKFPTLPASASGLEHFKEVKNIFTYFYILGAITLVPAIIIIVVKAKKKDISYLLVSSIMAVVVPLILGIFMMINFDETFILFHKLVFHNNYWLFDPTTDPVITILPDTFFMHCAIMIIFIVVLLSVIFFLIYNWKKRHIGIHNRKLKSLRL
ncbi:MAG TPA: TIGR01906 family membrane protein [Mobilitalea sp.]|nr:TIGR01906 family membrane protein [Mobilitalea sp.]